MRSSSAAARSQQIPEQEHPQGQTPVRAIALSISSVPVAAPAPGHDLRRQLMPGLLTRAGKRGECVRRGSLCAVVSVNLLGADSTKTPRVGDSFVTDQG